MLNNIGYRSASPYKRLTSFGIELLFAAVASGIVSLAKPGNDLGFLWVTWFALALETVISTIILGFGTVGDALVKLRTVRLDGLNLTRWRLLLRNVTYIFVLSGPLIDPHDVYNISIGVLIIVLLYLPVFSTRNIYGENMSALDLLFKTIIIQGFE